MKFLCSLILILSCSVGQAQSTKTGARACVNRYVDNKSTTLHQAGAMVDFVFNVGCGAFRKSTLLKKVNAGDMAGAADEFLKWTYIGKKRSAGLLRRRTEERALFLKP